MWYHSFHAYSRPTSLGPVSLIIHTTSVSLPLPLSLSLSLPPSLCFSLSPSFPLFLLSLCLTHRLFLFVCVCVRVCARVYMCVCARVSFFSFVQMPFCVFYCCVLIRDSHFTTCMHPSVTSLTLPSSTCVIHFCDYSQIWWSSCLHIPVPRLQGHVELVVLYGKILWFPFPYYSKASHAC